MKRNVITYDAVKIAVATNPDITDRGDMVRRVASVLGTNYGVVYLKVCKAEAELGMSLNSRRGRRAATKSVKAEMSPIEVVVEQELEEVAA